MRQGCASVDSGNKAVRKGRCSGRCNLDRNRNCVMGTGNVTFFSVPGGRLRKIRCVK